MPLAARDLETRCPHCLRPPTEHDARCPFGAVRSLPGPAPAHPSASADAHGGMEADPLESRAPGYVPASDIDMEDDERTPWLYLGLGLALLPLTWLPMPAWIGWYFSALVHELGHASTAWVLGCPAVPALGIGEAVTVETQQVLLLALVVWAALGTLAWTRLAGRARVVGMSLLLVAYPLLAFTDLGSLAKLTAGHAAELAFAALAIARAMTGGFTSSPAERALYALVGWHLVSDNLILTSGLATTASARAEYAASGSFGCVNDYIRVADRWAGGSLEAVALLATLAALAVPPLAIAARRRIAAH